MYGIDKGTSVLRILIGWSFPGSHPISFHLQKQKMILDKGKFSAGTGNDEIEKLIGVWG